MTYDKKQYNRDYYYKNKEKFKEAKKRYYEKHKDRLIADRKIYYQNNKQKYYEYSRRAWLKRRPEPLTPEQRSLVVIQAMHRKIRKEILGTR